MKQIDLNNETAIYQSEVARPSWISSWKEKQCGKQNRYKNPT